MRPLLKGFVAGPQPFRSSVTIPNSEPDAKFSTLRGNWNERPILESA
ncbi:hydroxymethylbilane synthase (porphobilinogen deaminase) (fragment) [Marinobacter nauticus ATCC 49840]